MLLAKVKEQDQQCKLKMGQERWRGLCILRWSSSCAIAAVVVMNANAPELLSLGLTLMWH